MSRTHLWRLPLWAEHRFQDLVNQLDLVEPESEEHYALLDEIRDLPGFPHRANPDTDFIRREIIQTPQMGVL